MANSGCTEGGPILVLTNMLCLEAVSNRISCARALYRPVHVIPKSMAMMKSGSQGAAMSSLSMSGEQTTEVERCRAPHFTTRITERIRASGQ